MSEKKIVIQKIWGVALLLAGIAMLFAIPSKIVEIQTAGGYSSGQLFFLQICFYIMSLVLTLGGVRKLYTHFWLNDRAEDTNEQK